MGKEDESKLLRKELIDKYINYGYESLSTLEILKLLLSFSGNKNVSELAVKLLGCYGNLNNLCDTDLKTIVKNDNISERSASLFRIIPVMSRLYNINKQDIQDFGNPESAAAFLKNCYIGMSEERIAVIALNHDFSKINYDFLSDGTNMSVSISSYNISKFALDNYSDMIIMSHNHPLGECEPSENDIYVTENIIKVLKNINVTLIDHIIIGQYESFSMREHFSDTLFKNVEDYGYKYNIIKNEK